MIYEQFYIQCFFFTRWNFEDLPLFKLVHHQLLLVKKLFLTFMSNCCYSQVLKNWIYKFCAIFTRLIFTYILHKCDVLLFFLNLLSKANVNIMGDVRNAMTMAIFQFTDGWIKVITLLVQSGITAVNKQPVQILLYDSWTSGGRKEMDFLYIYPLYFY